MNEDLVFELIKECTKVFNEIKKKQNEDLNTSLINCLNNLNSLKESLSKKEKENIEQNLLSISVSFIESTKQVLNLKYHKHFLNLLVLLKKFIEYSLFSKEKSGNVIELLKDFYNHPKTSDECQNKIIEILQTLIFSSFFEIKYDSISIIFILILKSFNNTNHSKNKDFKNPIRLILSTLTEKVYNSNNYELIIQTTILIFSWYNLSLKKKLESLSRKNSLELNKAISDVESSINSSEISDDIDDNLKEEINSVISQKKNNTYIQCLSLELLSQGFILINNNKEEKEKTDKFDINYLNKFIKNKILKTLMISLENIKKSNSVSEEGLNFLHYLKLCRFVKIIIFYYDVNYDIIQSIIDLMGENQNKTIWKTNISFELLLEIITNYEVLRKIYIWKKELVNTIFTCLNNFIKHIGILKEEKENKKVENNIISNFMKKKELDINKIYLEGDQIEISKEHSKKFYKSFLNDCLKNIIDSIIKNNKMENQDVKNENQALEKEIFEIICNNVKDILFKLLYMEFLQININTDLQGDCEIKIYINFVQSMMGLFNNLKMYEKRDEYLKYLCNMALDFSDEKDEDKNIFIAINILGISKATHLLNKDAFALILKTLQVFNRKYNYIKLNEYNKKDLDKIIKDINRLYKKFNKLDLEEIPIHYVENEERPLDEFDKEDKDNDEDNDNEKKSEIKEEIIKINEDVIEEIEEKNEEEEQEEDDNKKKENEKNKEEENKIEEKKEEEDDMEEDEKKEKEKNEEENNNNNEENKKEDKKKEKDKNKNSKKENEEKENKKKDSKKNKKEKKDKDTEKEKDKDKEKDINEIKKKDNKKNKKDKDKKEKEKEKDKDKEKGTNEIKKKDSKKSKKDKETNEIKKKDSKKSKKSNEKRDSVKSYNFRIEMRNKLVEGINTMFIDSNNLDFDSLKYIFESLSMCVESSIKRYQDNLKKKSEVHETEKENDKEKEEKEKDNVSKNSKNSKDNKENKTSEEEDPETIFNYQIIFYFWKILTITLLNIENIYLLFDPFISIVNKLIDNKLKVDFSIDTICALIPEIILKHDKIEENINKKLTEENKVWVNNKWQKLLFSPLLNILSQQDLYELLEGKIFVDFNKIIQQCGHYIDLFGWESILQSCTILSNYDIENAFLAVKQILNDYNIYITLFNMIPLMKLLQLFIFDENDRNTCFSAVELFWSCANIIDDFKQEKRHINQKEQDIFNELLKGKEIKVYCDEIYHKLFSYLISINDDKRIDVRKSGLNVFTEIFVSKMSGISPENSLKIINDIFFKVFSTNADKFISNNKDMETEQTLQSSMLDIIKILKEFYNENEKEKDLFNNYLNKIMEIIPVGSTPLNTDILKSILEIKTNKKENMPKIATKLDIYFKIILLMRDYIKGPNFSISQFNKVPTYKLFGSILSYLSSIFWDSNHIEIFTNDNLKNIFSIINTLFETVHSIEPKLLEIKPRKLLEFENDIFSFLEKIPIENNLIFSYIVDKIVFDYQDPHTEAVCLRALECVQNMICKPEKRKAIFGLKKEEKEIFIKLVEKMKDIMNLRNKDEVVECLVNTCTDKNNLKKAISFDQYIDIFIKIIDEMCNNFTKYKESMDDEIKEGKKETINNIYDIFFIILDLFEIIFNQSIEGFESINKLYLPVINEVYQQMEIQSINYIINKLLFYILFILGDEDQDIFEKIEEKIIKVIKLSCDISYNNPINNVSNDYLNQICINELMEVCRYKTNEEILSNIKNEKIKINKDKYINNQIKIGKICTTLLIQKMIELLKKFREDEIKLGDMPLNRVRIQEVVILLQNVKTLEVFPNINVFDEDKDDIKDINKDITFFDVASKSKKIHLFYLQPILNDFIDTKEKEVKNLVKEIFKEITNVIAMPELKSFGK